MQGGICTVTKLSWDSYLRLAGFLQYWKFNLVLRNVLSSERGAGCQGTREDYIMINFLICIYHK